MGRERLSFEKYSQSNEKKAEIFIKKNDSGTKWVADYIDLGVLHYEITTFKKKHTGNNPTKLFENKNDRVLQWTTMYEK